MGLKKYLAGLLMACGAVAAPMAAKAKTHTNNDPKAVESKEEKATKLKEAIHLGLPREEVLKYIDFPKWLPVTKSGEYDWLRAQQMFDTVGLDKPENQEAFQKYVDSVKKGENADAAFESLATQISKGDFFTKNQIMSVKEGYQKMLEQSKGKIKTERSLEDILAVVVGTLTTFSTLSAAGACIVRAGKSKSIAENDEAARAAVFCAIIAMAAGGFTYYAANNYIDLSKECNNVLQQVYENHVNQEIQKANPKVVTIDMNQAKQMIGMSKNGMAK